MTKEGNASRVVVVDDNGALRNQMHAILHQAGAMVVGEASDGRLALGAIRRLHPDIVILDLQMPVMDGLEVLQELRDRSIDVAVLVAGVADDKDMIRRAFELGALGYVTKPFREDRILSVYSQVVAIHARRRAGARAAGTSIPPARSTVLVDSDAAERGLLRSILENGGYTVAAEADNGMAGLTAVESENPDFVCLAVDLPEIDGLNVLSCLHAVHPELPVIMVTAHSDRETVTRAIASGVKGYIIKPLELDKVLAAVRQMLA